MLAYLSDWPSVSMPLIFAIVLLGWWLEQHYGVLHKKKSRPQIGTSVLDKPPHPQLQLQPYTAPGSLHKNSHFRLPPTVVSI